MSHPRLRVALDLSGPPESLGNWVALLATALRDGNHCDVVTFVTGHDHGVTSDAHVRGRTLWRSQWYRGTGRAVDRALPPVDVVHVTGRATPPTKSASLVVSVDDLRPLREDSRGRQRITQLQRVVARGAQLVASSRTASVEVQRALGLQRDQVVSIAPAVFFDRLVDDGEDLVVHVTGASERFIEVAPSLVRLARHQGSRVVVLASREAGARIRQASSGVTVRHRADAHAVLLRARLVVHLSDGARFPSFVAAALAAGVPTCATSTAVNRELLEGATVLVDEHDDTAVAGAVEDLWENDARRAVLVAAGRARAADYSPAVAARQYAALYESMATRGVRV